MLSNECCNGCACHNWIKAMGYDPDDSYPDDVCYKCDAEGPYYLFNQAQEYGWGGGAQTMESLRRLREEKEDVIEHLFQYIVQRLKSKINFSGIVVSFEERLGSNEKAIAVADSMLTLAASGLECYESDEDAKAYYDQATEGKVPLSVEAFSQFRQLIADEMAIWFVVRGLLLIGEPVEEVERILTSKLEEL